MGNGTFAVRSRQSRSMGSRVPDQSELVELKFNSQLPTPDSLIFNRYMSVNKYYLCAPFRKRGCRWPFNNNSLICIDLDEIQSELPHGREERRSG